MNSKLFFSLIFLFTLSSLAQQLSVNGRVTDERNQPIAFCNVTLTETTNKNLISGTTTNEEGDFLLENLKPAEYILSISYLGFNTYKDTLTLQKNLAFNSIILKEQTQDLEGVTVIAKRPTVKRMVDRLIFNVENSTLSNTNVLDVLKHTPGVLVYNDNITVKNSTPTIYVNDRKVHLSLSEVQQLLEGTSSGNVKSVEVISNPPAKYEAEGGAVINIVLSKNLLPGYNGTIFGNYKQGEQYPKYSFGTSHFLKGEVIDAYFNYGISPRKDFRHNTENINFIENDEITTMWETDFKRTRKSSDQNFNANLDFKINNNNTIGISSSVLISPKRNSTTDVASITDIFDKNHSLDSLFNTKNHIADKRTNIAFTLDYEHHFKKEGERLQMSVHHTNYDFSSDQLVDTDYFLPDRTTLIRNNTFQTLSSQKVELYTGQIDYELPINSNSSFEAGAKVSTIDSESRLDQFNLRNGQFVTDEQNSDTFLYDETNYAVYTSYSKQWNSWSLKLGLRTEYTDITGNSLSTNQLNENDYVEFFPSFHLLHSFNENHDLYFNYNRRIYRPRYDELNPFKYFLNDNAFIVGNPKLRPEIDDVFTLGYTLKKKFTWEAYFRFENDPTLKITFQDNEKNLIKMINTNIDRNITYGLDFTTYTNITSQWNLYVLTSLFYYEGKFFSLDSNNEIIKNDKWSVYGQLINSFSFLKGKSLTADVSYLYISPIVDGPANYTSRHGLDISVRKILWKNRASLSLGVTDVFNTQNYTGTTKYLDQDYYLKSRMENRMLTFGFNYKFGNTYLKNNRRDIDMDERDRLNSKKD